MHVQSDAIVHYGHTCFSKSNIPVHFVLNEKSLNIEPIFEILKESLTVEKRGRLCLFYDCAFEHVKGK